MTEKKVHQSFLSSNYFRLWCFDFISQSDQLGGYLQANRERVPHESAYIQALDESNENETG
jgi:hypothetical protein